ncbi:MAG: D-alanine--D-alanine ligase [Rubricoccaceae bacterium]
MTAARQGPRVGLIYDRFGDREPPPGAPPDWDAEYEPEETLVALEDALRHLGCVPVRVGNADALLTAMTAGSLLEPPFALDAALSIAEGYGSRNREAHAPVLLELANVPALGSDALALSVSLDKHLAKVVALHAGVATPPWAVVSGAEELARAALPPFPLIVKPRYEGTAKGIGPQSRCEGAGALHAEVARQTTLYGQDVLVEAFVAGAEFTVGVTGTGAAAVAGPALQRAVERTTGIGLHALERYEDPAAPFSYDTPAVITPALEEALRNAALAVHRALGCRDFSRSDFRVDAAGRHFFLEINPLPTFAPDGTFAVEAELAGVPYAAHLASVLRPGLARLGLVRAA